MARKCSIDGSIKTLENRCGSEISMRITLINAKTAAMIKRTYPHESATLSIDAIVKLTVFAHILLALAPSRCFFGPLRRMYAKSTAPQKSNPTSGTGSTATASKHGEKSNTRKDENGR